LSLFVNSILPFSLYARAAVLAEAEGKSLNTWTQEQMQKAVMLA
jgi:predicted HicB family RNase H-like nuclease